MKNIKNFILYSILGFLFEMILSLIFKFKSDSGFMYGPYTIVYGLGVTFTFLLYDKFKSINDPLKKIIISFISGFITITLLEFTGGLLLKEIYGIKMWNYSGLPLSIGKYISVEISTIWTIGSLLIYNYVKPYTDKLLKKTPNIIMLGILLIMLLDFIITSINILT